MTKKRLTNRSPLLILDRDLCAAGRQVLDAATYGDEEALPGAYTRLGRAIARNEQALRRAERSEAKLKASEAHWRDLLNQQLRNFISAAPSERPVHARGMWVLMQIPPESVDDLTTDVSEEDATAIIRWLDGKANGNEE